jgi:uncharacterized protein YggU (UPF0235/DUF167 family)
MSIRYSVPMYIHVRVQAGAKQESFTQISETHFEATVKEKAERNQANERVVTLIKQFFPAAIRVMLVSGHHSPSKLFAVELLD